MKTVPKIIIVLSIIFFVSVAVTIIIAKTGAGRKMPIVTETTENIFNGRQLDMRVDEMVSLYNEAFNKTSEKKKIISNGHFYIDTNRSSWRFGVSNEKLSMIQLKTYATLLEYSDYEMIGLQYADLKTEDVIYASARESDDSIELKIKIKECEFIYEKYSDEVKTKNIPLERAGFGTADIYNIFEAVGKNSEDKTITLKTGTFNNRNDYTEYGPVSLNCIIDKETHTIKKCNLNYDLCIKSGFFTVEDTNGNHVSSFKDIEFYVNADFSFPYKTSMPVIARQTVS